jgi:alkanesulfonate monooxygenase SsuD/methylene tetrahydromethanopterin reductase-like flavin-dependent oxidoreductase (luciferase family)
VELGVYTFADVALGAGGVGPAQRLREVVEEAALTDQVGLSVFGVGEHHRADYAAPAPATVLAAAAERTTDIRLTSAVSVLSSDDPVRVFQQFATLDLLSRSRWRSSGASPSGSRRWRTCTAACWRRPGMTSSR